MSFHENQSSWDLIVSPLFFGKEDCGPFAILDLLNVIFYISTMVNHHLNKHLGNMLIFSNLRILTPHGITRPSVHDTAFQASQPPWFWHPGWHPLRILRATTLRSKSKEWFLTSSRICGSKKLMREEFLERTFALLTWGTLGRTWENDYHCLTWGTFTKLHYPLELPPHPVTVTRIIPFLLGNPNLNLHFWLFLGGG